VKRRIELTEQEREIYEWQMWTPGFGEAGQKALKQATVLVSRCGGVGGTVAYYLAAAGIGRLILAHGGELKHSDLNRQLLMTHDWIGKPRIESVRRRLLDLNPRLSIVSVPENISDGNACELVGRADVIVDCAPLFQERFALNREAVLQRKPLVECAMYDLEAQITTILPGATPCLACRFPTQPEAWKRQFPVFGAVSGMVGSLGALEAIKIISGVAKPLAGELLSCDLREMTFRKIKLKRNPECRVCMNAHQSSAFSSVNLEHEHAGDA
jgi:molybdopterin/thiamine biosynthesis adenylyltransferase